MDIRRDNVDGRRIEVHTETTDTGRVVRTYHEVVPMRHTTTVSETVQPIVVHRETLTHDESGNVTDRRVETTPTNELRYVVTVDELRELVGGSQPVPKSPRMMLTERCEPVPSDWLTTALYAVVAVEAAGIFYLTLLRPWLVGV